MTQEILGGGPFGHALPTRLNAHDRSITSVDSDVGVSQDSGIDAYESTLGRASSLIDFSLQTIVVAARNLLLGTSARSIFEVDRIINLLDDRRDVTAFEDTTICASDTLAEETACGLITRKQSNTAEKSAGVEQKQVHG